MATKESSPPSRENRNAVTLPIKYRGNRHAAYQNKKRVPHRKSCQRKQGHHVCKAELDAGYRHDRIQWKQPLGQRQYDRERGQQAAERYLFRFHPSAHSPLTYDRVNIALPACDFQHNAVRETDRHLAGTR